MTVSPVIIYKKKKGGFKMCIFVFVFFCFTYSKKKNRKSSLKNLDVFKLMLFNQ